MQTDKDSNLNGSIVIEATIVLVIFIAVIASIIIFIPIFMVHNKMQFAITQAANELSSYTYVYAAFGLKEVDENIGNDAENNTASADKTAGDSLKAVSDAMGFIDTINSNLTGAINDPWGSDYEQLIANIEQSGELAEESGEQAINSITALINEYAENPKLLLLAIGHYGFQKLEVTTKAELGQLLGKALAEKYLNNGDTDADTYLKSIGIEEGIDGLNFKGSSLFADENYRVIDIRVSYEVKLWFTIIPGVESITIENRCATTGWLGDD